LNSPFLEGLIQDRREVSPGFRKGIHSHSLNFPNIHTPGERDKYGDAVTGYGGPRIPDSKKAKPRAHAEEQRRGRDVHANYMVDQNVVKGLRLQSRASCSSLILSGHLLDYIARGQLEFRENSGAFRLTLSENRLGLYEKSLITSNAAWIR
jgi:hypothetical protein